MFELALPVNFVSPGSSQKSGLGFTERIGSKGVVFVSPFAFERTERLALSIRMGYSEEAGQARCRAVVVKCEPTFNLGQPAFRTFAYFVSRPALRRGDEPEREARSEFLAAAAVA